jgi:NADH:ubiquinone oxidoreductase subunit 6 (subunit J)
MTPSLASAEGLSGLLFLVFVLVTVAGALIAVHTRQLIRAVAGLGLCFIGVAGLYYSLHSPFVALMQVLIYVGAVCVTIIFAVMLADPVETPRPAGGAVFFGALGVIASGALVWALATLALKTPWKAFPGASGQGSVDQMGVALLTSYSMSFELISVVLLVAIIGSLVLARLGRSKQ